ncbi:hypothetical protein E4T43_08200, partial [Aureobasidium subglaciale]
CAISVAFAYIYSGVDNFVEPLDPVNRTRGHGNPAVYNRLESRFTIIRPLIEQRQRPAFLQALRLRDWGDLDAVLRLLWTTGDEMGRWDADLFHFFPSLARSLPVQAPDTTSRGYGDLSHPVGFPESRLIAPGCSLWRQ